MTQATIELDPELSRAFAGAAARAHEAPGQLLEAFMRDYVAREEALKERIRRESALIAARAADPASDEAAVNRMLEHFADHDGWTA